VDAPGARSAGRVVPPRRRGGMSHHRGAERDAGGEGPVALDPVCGMTVDPARAAGHVDHGGTTYHFCSKGCVAKFSADPNTYLSGPPSRPAAASAGQAPALLSIGGLKRAAPAAPGTSHP